VGIDKRIFKRLEIKINVRYRMMTGNQLGQEYLSIATNLSAGGLSLLTNQKFEKNSILRLSIELPDSKDPIECLSRIVRFNKSKDGSCYEAGVYFLDLSGKDRLKLEHFISKEL